MDYLDRIPDEKDDDFEGMLRGLAYARNEVNKTKEELRALLTEFQNSPEYKRLSSFLEVASVSEQMYDDLIREEALRTNKALPKEIVIKNFKDVAIFDKNRAEEWCVANFRPALTLDEKVFKSIVKNYAIVPAEIAKVVEEKRAQIAKDLSKYLE